jgi:RNA polymerase sigma factor (sigma-70 family)
MEKDLFLLLGEVYFIMGQRLINSARTRSMVVAVVLGTALGSLTTPEQVSASPSSKSLSDITRYCQTCWRNARIPQDYWPDCTQEVFVRLMERVSTSRWDSILQQEGEDRRELLRAIDAVKKRTQRGRRFNSLADEIVDPRLHPAATKNDLREELSRCSSDILSPRQQQIIEMCGQGWSIPEIAQELNTTVERVSDEKYKAIRKLRKHLQNDDDREEG